MYRSVPPSHPTDDSGSPSAGRRSFGRIGVIVAVAVALVLSAGGGAVAAKKYTVSSSKQVKPGVVQYKHLSKKAKKQVTKKARGKKGTAGATGPAGAQGAAGATGPQGEPGPSHAYTDELEYSIGLAVGQADQTIVEVDVPAGSYTVQATLHGMTGATAGSVVHRFDCNLAGADRTIRVTPQTDEYVTLPLLATATLSSAGKIALRCMAGNSRALWVYDADLVATRVGDLTTS